MNSVFIKIIGNEDRNKISDEFEFRSYLTSHFGVTCPWAVKKWCLQRFSVTFDWIFVKLASNEDRHKSSTEFDFGPDRIVHLEVIRPLARIFCLAWTLHVGQDIIGISGSFLYTYSYVLSSFYTFAPPLKMISVELHILLKLWYFFNYCVTQPLMSLEMIMLIS